MLELTIPISPEGWDEENQRFVEPTAKVLRLEHSLVSISKWESKWNKPFLSKVAKTTEETVDYIKCMTITQNVDPEVYKHLTSENVKEINDYISAPMTATTFSEDKNSKNNREIVTAELVYYWMFSLGIPKELEKWHLNRLLTLIRVFNLKNEPPKKRSKRDIMSRNAALNAARKKQLNTSG